MPTQSRIPSAMEGRREMEGFGGSATVRVWIGQGVSGWLCIHWVGEVPFYLNLREIPPSLSRQTGSY